MKPLHGVCAALVMVLGAGWAAGCGTAQLNELGEVQLDCDFDGTECVCYGNDIDDTDPRECSASSMKGVCCELGHSSAPNCTCQTLGCAVSGNVCWCGVQETSMTSCSPPSGVCCVSPSVQECRCYFSLGVCPAGEQPVANCTTGQLNCDVLGGGTQRSSCSAVKIVDVDGHDSQF